MQIKNNQPNNLRKSRLIGLLKLALLVGCLFFLYDKLQDQPISLSEIKWPNGFWFTLTVVCLLMTSNWYLEVLRWKYSIQVFESISTKEAWRAVLGGLALNWVLPLTSGDLIVRISQQQDQYKTTSAALLNRFIMLCFTILLGGYGISHLAKNYDWSWWVLIPIALLMVLGLMFRNSFRRFIAYFKQLNQMTFLRVFGLSLLRYLIFVSQFLLVLQAFLPMLSISLLIAGIGWIFLIRSALPLFLGGIGIREASGVLFFEPHVNQLHLVLIPIFLIWIINTVIPSLVGMLLFLKWKPAFAK
ncbi:hypothetical protein [Ekhidna sp.]|uniref:hypothetical protein n=1 Tax=Ekhidna sp. TaxID=2608089 RepID=UPI0032979527